MKLIRVLAFVALAVLVVLMVAVGTLYALFDGPRVKAEIAKTMMEQKHRTLDIPGELKLSVWPSLAVKLGKVSLTEPNSSQIFVSADSARVAVAVMPLLTRQVSVSAVELDGLRVNIIKGKDGSLNFADLLAHQVNKPGVTVEAQPAVATPKQAARIDVAAIALRNAEVLWWDQGTGSRSALSHLDLSTGRIEVDTGSQSYAIHKLAISAKGQSNADTFALRLDAPRLALTGDQAQGDSIQMVATLEGAKRTLHATLALAAVQGSLKALHIEKMRLDLDASANESRVKGVLESAVALNVTEQTVALSSISGKLELAHPSMPMKQLTLPVSGHLLADFAKSRAELGLATQFDDSKIALKAQVARFSPLALGFDLDINQLNLDKYLAPPAKGPATAVAPTVPATAPADPPVDLTALQGLDVNGAIKIGALQVSNIKAAQLVAKLDVKAGQLILAPFSAELYNGKLAGSLSAQAGSNAIALRQVLTGVAIGPLLKDLVNQDMVDGHGTISMDLTTRGPTVGALKKGLTGNATLHLKDGAIKGINLAKSLRELKAKLGAGAQGASQKANADEKTDFSELSGSFKLFGGVAHNDDLAMKSPYLRLGGIGDIDIGNSHINYLAKVSVVNTAAGQEGQDLDQLKGLTIPVRLVGPFNDLSYQIDYANLLNDAAKARVNAKIDETKHELNKKLEDAVKDRLKGLLGR